jgi:hypothetical protein
MTDEPIIAEVVEEGDEETVDGLPVLAEVRPVQSALPAQLGVVQTAAAAATGFVAGAAVLAVAHHLASKRLARAQQVVGVRRSQWQYLPVTSTRTYIVDVHTLGHPGE